MITVYSMSVKPLHEESLFKAACDKLDTGRLEKMKMAKRTEDKILCVGAGLLLQFAVQKGPVFDSEQDMECGNGMTQGGQRQQDGRMISCSEADINQILQGIREPIEFEFVYGPHGKPYFKASVLKEEKPLFFSLSHSGDYVLCALSDEEVGADIQRIPEADAKKVVREDQIAERFFTEQERIWYQQEDAAASFLPEKKRRRFYRIWAAKEAYMKWTGNGLTEGVSAFEVDLNVGTVKGVINVRLCEVKVADGYTACVCVGEKV